VYTIYQTAPNNGWSGWSGLGGWVSDIEVVNNALGNPEVFAIGSDNALYHKWFTPGRGWSDWASLGGWIDDMEIVIFEGRPHVHAVGSNDAMHQRWWDNGWHGWANIDGEFSSIEQSVLNENGGIEIFAIDHDNNLVHKSFERPQGWSDWTNIATGYHGIEIVLRDNNEAVTNTITGFYRDILLRDPDQGGLNNWINAYYGGMGMSQIEGGFRTSPEASNVAPNEITQYYNDILLREPEADELQFWLDEFVNGMSYSEIEYEIRNSEEAQLLQVPTRSSFAIGAIGQIPMRGGELDAEQVEVPVPSQAESPEPTQAEILTMAIAMVMIGIVVAVSMVSLSRKR